MTILAPFAERGEALSDFLERQGIAAAWTDGGADTCYVTTALRELLRPAAGDKGSSVPVAVLPRLFRLYAEHGERRLTTEELPLVRAQRTGTLQEAVIVAKSGHEPLRRFRWTAVPLPSTDSSGQAALAVVTTAPDADPKADLFRAHADLMQTLHHELRTPLTSILGYAELLAEQSAHFPGSVASAVEAIQRAGWRLSRLAEALSSKGEVFCDGE
jgi:signal transduction histidine kinase